MIALLENNPQSLKSNSAAVSRRFSDGNVPLNRRRTPARAKAQPTIEELRENLDYDPSTGILRWKNPRPGLRAGTMVRGKNSQGYLRVTVNGHTLYAHRVAFALMHNRWPDPCCDHINGDPTDNRAANLRECDFSCNVQNTRTPRNNTSGVKGVVYHKQSDGWVAYVTLRRKKHTRYFKQFECAAAYAKQLREKLHGEFARH